MRTTALTFALLFSTLTLFAQQPAMDQTVYQFTPNNISGQPQSLETYRGKVLLFVNVASECGYTPQYEGLQALYEKYKDRGLVILGFPCNQFGFQEPGDGEEIQNFCKKNYGVTFPLFEKIEVKGKDAHPLYEFLTSASLNGKMDSEVKWNFQKYLVGPDGHLVQMFAPKVKPDDAELVSAIEALFQ